ncbi:hypothetical protein FHR83_006759 [Actinoplanes campanulatus]|uniref:Uncharacterized protein n=1 Tax=Actinoplanes campanulatus TaxID=113559 RepID=A0A7W5FHV4_9ACTN|nr:hypothetical protein [Actinoplanes campanulatus]MBB3099053.1 hypothetical protein [Actinoplanes campanulatus]GGN39245.1 hypothetical protein GCM10010109_66980 [Actinoplanes campanulatus]GID40211.1 hypothetical protein Aca09nite_67170 [Actinoplanes campanulatus]
MIALASTQRYLIDGAVRDTLTYQDGVFRLDGVLLPEPDAQQARALVFAGLLAVNRTDVQPTTTGRAAAGLPH